MHERMHARTHTESMAVIERISFEHWYLGAITSIFAICHRVHMRACT